MVLHALTSLTYVVVAVARRLGLIGRSGSDGVIRWLVYAPKGGETYCSGIIIHIGGPTLLLQGLPARLPVARARESRSGKDDPLPRFIDGNPTSNT